LTVSRKCVNFRLLQFSSRRKTRRKSASGNSDLSLPIDKAYMIGPLSRDCNARADVRLKSLNRLKFPAVHIKKKPKRQESLLQRYNTVGEATASGHNCQFEKQ